MSLIKYLLLISIVFILPRYSYGDIGKVYHPYVEPLEREIELMMTRSFDNFDEHENFYTLGYGQAVRENLFIELSGRARQSDQEHIDMSNWELEAVYQITEKGAGPIDVGVLFEAEREPQKNISETAISLLLESELGQTSLTANLGLAYEFGSGIDNEYDRSLRAQWRYRLQPSFEPALELHMDEYDKAAGPAILGLLRLGNRQKLRWELGLFFALEKETPDQMLRAVLEYEF